MTVTDPVTNRRWYRDGAMTRPRALAVFSLTLALAWLGAPSPSAQPAAAPNMPVVPVMCQPRS